MEILIATRNVGKAREIASLLDASHIHLRSLDDFPAVGEIEETGATFAINAELKARFYASATRLMCLADDSGLEVAALAGAPGVLSARYGKAGATDAERIAKLLNEIDRTGDRERRARFVCVVVIAEPDRDEIELFTGECRGRIAHSPRGVSGFGYDPVFVPDGYTQTFAELPPEIKDRISHRAHALSAMRALLARRVRL